MTREADTQRIVERVNRQFAWRQLAGKTILLSGACGFLGRWFQHTIADVNRRYLSSTPVTLIGWDSLIAAELYGEPDPNIRLHLSDVAAPVYGDYIIHAAAIASPPRYLTHPLETIDAAVAQTRVLLEAARWNHSRMMFFGSSEVYGDPDGAHLPTKEDYRGNVAIDAPRSCYDESKRMGETLCDVYFRHFETDVVRVRPFNVYGPEMAPDDQRAVPNLIAAALAGKPFKMYGSGMQTRTWCYVEDAMVGFWLVLLKGRSGQAYNIGCEGPELTMLELVQIFRSVHPLEVEEIPSPTFDQGAPTRRCPDLSKAFKDLGYAPEVTLSGGLRRTAEAAAAASWARSPAPARGPGR